MRDKALRYLQAQDAVFHMDMLEAIRRGHAALIAAGERGVLLRETGGGAFLLTAQDEAAARDLLDAMPPPEAEPFFFVAHQDFELPELEKRYGVKPHMRCYQAAWMETGRVIVPERPYALARLDESYLSVVTENYSNHVVGEGYVAGRIAAGEMFGAFAEDGELIGFIGLHEEGSMGMLEVDPAYRRKGVGAALVAYLSNMQLQQGFIPYSQFVLENEASYSLNRRLGFSISEQLLCWTE